MPESNVDVVVAAHICLDMFPELGPLAPGALEAHGRLFQIGRLRVTTGGLTANVGVALHRLGAKVRLLTTASQHEAIGAIVTVRGQHGSITQLVSRASGFGAQPPELVFGVGESRLVRAEVRWPSGRSDSYGGIRRNSRVLLVETLGAPEPIEGRPARLGDPAPGR